MQSDSGNFIQFLKFFQKLHAYNFKHFDSSKVSIYGHVIKLPN